MTTEDEVMQFVDEALNIFGTQKAVIYKDNFIELEEKAPDSWEITALKIASALVVGIFLLIAKVVLRCSHTYEITPAPTPGAKIKLNFEKLIPKYSLPDRLVTEEMAPDEHRPFTRVKFSFGIDRAMEFVINRINASITSSGPLAKVDFSFDYRATPAPEVLFNMRSGEALPKDGPGMIKLIDENYRAIPENPQLGPYPKNLLANILNILKREGCIQDYHYSLHGACVYPQKAAETKTA
ncbi:MAG: hypothetical protein HYX48_03090 [Chlamydiales bacterium]|nr:hypothetical protein [Chlamydiales bacterium]